MPVGGLPNVGATCFMASCLQAVCHVTHVAALLRERTCSSFVVGMLRRVSEGARVSATSMQTFVGRCNEEFGLQRRDGEHYDAKECFDAVICNDHCPPLQKVFRCVTLPGATPFQDVQLLLLVYMNTTAVIALLGVWLCTVSCQQFDVILNAEACFNSTPHTYTLFTDL